MFLIIMKKRKISIIAFIKPLILNKNFVLTNLKKCERKIIEKTF